MPFQCEQTKEKKNVEGNILTLYNMFYIKSVNEKNLTEIVFINIFKNIVFIVRLA